MTQPSRDLGGGNVKEITQEVRDKIGNVIPFTETYDFQCAEKTDAEIAALSDKERFDRLLAARNVVSPWISEISRGYWGDLMLPWGRQAAASPGAWTKVGSPEWLDELFPGWNEPEAPNKI